MKIPHRNHKAQRGVVLLILCFTIFAIAATMFLGSVDSRQVELREEKNLQYDMEQAKQALIAYTVNYQNYGFNNDGDASSSDEGPGRLPCPDIDDDGLKDDNSTDCTDYVRGRLPDVITYGGNSMRVNSTYADVDQQFWYVVTPGFLEITTTGVNILSTPTLTIDGVSGYIAAIIAPGEEVGSQDRSSSTTSAANYLEQGNVSGTALINSYPANPDNFNDKVIGIKLSDISTQMLNQVVPKLGTVLDGYYTDNGIVVETKSDFLNYMTNNVSEWYVEEGWGDDLSFSNTNWSAGPFSYSTTTVYQSNCSSRKYTYTYKSWGTPNLTTSVTGSDHC